MADTGKTSASTGETGTEIADSSGDGSKSTAAAEGGGGGTATTDSSDKSGSQKPADKEKSPSAVVTMPPSKESSAPPPETKEDDGQNQDDDEDEEEPNAIGSSPTGRFLKYIEEVGRGSFKTVYRGLDTDSGVAVAWCELQVYIHL